jgi:arylsulfatase A-like enzyme
MGAVAGAMAVDRPNVIFVLCDDLGYGDLGEFFQNARAAANDRSEPWHFTPQLDALATAGMQLRQHYCPAPVCAPSRASLLLGVHQGHANVRDNQFDKALEDNHTLATVLKQAGYATACFGKWGLQGSGSNPSEWPAYPTKRGFDYYFGYVRHGDGHEHYPKEGKYRGAKQVWENGAEISSQLDKCYTTDLFTARAKRWIMDHQATNAAQPFFMYLAFDTPHAVLELPTQAYPAGGGTNGGLQWIGTPGAMINTASGTIDSYTHPDYASATYDDDGNPGTAEVAWPAVYRRYATSVRRIDDCVGDLKLLLEQLNIVTNTLLVFTSDNGPSKEDYLNFAVSYAPNFFNSFGPFDGIKRDVWEGGVRMCTIAHWPGHIAAGTTNHTPSQFHDWLPTFADLGGVPIPARSDGVSLVPSLTGVGSQKDSTIYIEYYNNGTTPSYTEFLPAHRGRTRQQMQVLRLGDHVGVRYNITSHADDFEIYNVVSDPQQGINLAGSLPALQQHMKDTVLRLRRPNASASRPYDGEWVPSTNATPVTLGVEWATYTNAFPWVPELTDFTPAAAGQTNTVTLAVRPRDNTIGILFTGYLNVPSDGDYTFYLAADTGALLRIHEATVLEADFGYVGGTERSATIKLQAGKHPYRLYYARGSNGIPSLDWSWAGPGFTKQPVPENALLRSGVAPPGPPQAGDDTASTAQGASVLINVLANDFDDGTPQPLGIQSVEQPFSGANQVVADHILYTPDPGFLGEDTFHYTVTDGADTSTGEVRVTVYLAGSDLIWFPFNQTSGLVTGEAGSNLTALLNGFTDDTSAWAEGRFGRGLQLQSALSQFATMDGFYGIGGASNRTCAAWIKTTSTALSPVFGWGINSTGQKWTLLLNSGSLRCEISSGYVHGATLINDGQWHHVACTFANDGSPDATDILLYIDGILETNFVATSPTLVNSATSAQAMIGRDVQGRLFDGLIDEARIYRRALNPTEIAELAAADNQSAAAWYRRYYGDVPINWLGDSEGDGNTQMAEYAFGGNPRVPDRLPGLAAAIVADSLQIGYPRAVPGTSDLLYALEKSSDWAGWSSWVGNDISSFPLMERPGYEWAVFQAASSVYGFPMQLVRLQAAFSNSP